MRVRELVSTETAAGRLSRELQTLADINLKINYWMKEQETDCSPEKTARLQINKKKFRSNKRWRELLLRSEVIITDLFRKLL